MHSSGPPPKGISYPVIVGSPQQRGTVSKAVNMPMLASSTEVVEGMTKRPTLAKERPPLDYLGQ